MFSLRIIPALVMLISPTVSQQGGDEFKEGLDRWGTFPQLTATFSYYDFSPGAWVTPSKGEVWPKPQFQLSQQEFFSLRSESFNLVVCYD